MSSECNNVKLAIRNDKSEVVCAMCKQCLITANHDVCVLNYVNGMNSRGKKQKANVLNTKNQKKQKPKFKKPKKVGSQERVASPKPSKPKICLRWSPIGRIFDIKGKIIATSKSECQSDCSNGDNAYDYSRYTWVHFLKAKYKAPEVIKTFLKKIIVLLQAPVIMVRTNNGTKFKNQVLQEYFNSVGISHQTSSTRTPQQNGVVECRNRTLVEAARTILQLTGKKIMETMSVTFDELSAMVFEQSSLKPRLQSMTSGQIRSGLNLTYAPSTITTQQPTKHELDLLFEAMYDDYIGGQPSAATRTALAAQAPLVLQTPTTTTATADTTPTPTNSSSQATNILNTSPDVDELKTQQQHV
ncbi:retrovirus-related pol polyprotein from transposon TNT 1-94 [Tanacetum coccineum]